MAAEARKRFIRANLPAHANKRQAARLSQNTGV
jgi:hypothetical protein